MDLHALGRQAVALHQQGRLVEAEALYHQILAENPNVYPAIYLLGTLKLQTGDSTAAADLLLRALALNPRDPAANLQYGLALQGQLRFADSLPPLEIALNAAPGPARLARATALRVLGRDVEALQDYEAVLATDPGSADAWNGRGVLLRKAGRITEAEVSFGHAISLMPDFVEALDNRARLLMDRTAYQAALDDLKRVEALAPDRPMVDVNIAHLQMLVAIHECDWTQASIISRDLPARVSAGGNVAPFLLLQYSDDARLQLEAAKNQISQHYPPAKRLAGKLARHDGPIRLGYLSSDFRDHAVAAQAVEVLERHDRARFMLFGLSTRGDDGSAIRRRIKGAFDHFIDIEGLPPEKAAQQIAVLNLDLLVDLNGHTQNHSFEILRHKPAQVQVEWLGYAGTTGAPYMDFIVADRVIAPDPRVFAEQVAYMPTSFFPADTTRAVAAPPSRAAMGLPQDALVFCCFNHHWKFTADVFCTWLRLLRQLPDSVLWLRTMPQAPLGRLQQAARDAGIDPIRLVQAGRAPLDLHLARHGCADLFLDTLPYNAHATASDALYAGLPVLTVKGATFAGRVAASLLEACGLPELIAADLDDYESKALNLARNPQALGELRTRLARARQVSPLFDMDRFTRDLESLYLSMISE